MMSVKYAQTDKFSTWSRELRVLMVVNVMTLDRAISAQPLSSVTNAMPAIALPDSVIPLQTTPPHVVYMEECASMEAVSVPAEWFETAKINNVDVHKPGLEMELEIAMTKPGVAI